ncbi:MAG: glycosyltransferase family 4 protein [Bacteroidota bacterium]|nr:glycosyltransferase family 4 protein [Bacteroidota bacterium]
MHSKKILHVITSESWGGLEIYVAALIIQLQKSGVNQSVFVTKNSLIAKELQSNGVAVYLTQTSSQSNFSKFIQLFKTVKQGNFNVIHSHTSKDARIACMTAWIIPNLKHIFSLYMGATNKNDIIHRILYHKIDVLISSSENTNSEVKTMYPIRPEKVQLIRYGRDINLYQSNIEIRNKLRAEYNCDNDTIVVATMARIDPAKGIREIAESYSYLPSTLKEKVQIWIIGERNIIRTLEDGTKVHEEESNKLYQYVQTYISDNQLENHVKLIPFQKEYISFLGAIDIFVLASWYEMYSLSVIDAMCMGLPVIGANTGGTPEQVKDGERGIQIPIKSPEKIAEAIQTLALDHAKRKELGSNARKWASENHSWGNVISKISEIYLTI